MSTSRLGLLFMAALAVMLAPPGARARRPNVLFIMADDLRPQLGCYGDPYARTPRIDRLAERSLRFDRAYVQCPICSPSRNSMLSGLRPSTSGLQGFGTTIRDKYPDLVTLPQHFKNNGYHARGFGKIYHIYAESMLGDENDPLSWSEPLRQPVPPVWGPEQNALRDRLIAEGRAAGKKFDKPHSWPRAATWDDSDLPDEAMQDGDTALAACEFLATRTGDEEPFFLAVGFLRPHLPFNAPRRHWNLYEPSNLQLPSFDQLPIGAPEWSVRQGIVGWYHNMPSDGDLDSAYLQRYLQGYLACISYVDACVGVVLDALEASGHADDTIVLFMGDHGYQMGEYGSWGHKQSNFEISLRTPLLISAPGSPSHGAATESLVEFLDLYPSLCDLAGLVAPEHLEGKSFAALLDDPSSAHRNAAASEYKTHRRSGRTIRTDDYRYIEWRGRKGELVARELYDHRGGDATLLETVNVIASPEHASVLPRLAATLDQAFNAPEEK